MYAYRQGSIAFCKTSEGLPSAAGNAGDRLASWAAATFGLAVAAPFLDVRPQLYGLLCWALVVDATVGRSQPRPWLPIVFLIWANLHASFVLGLLTLPIVLLPNVRRREHRRRVLILAAVCAGATLINPHGGAGVMRALEHAFDPTSPIHLVGEWLPPFEPGGLRSWLYPYGIGAFVVATLVATADADLRSSPDTWVAVAIGATVLAMSLRSRPRARQMLACPAWVHTPRVSPAPQPLHRKPPATGTLIMSVQRYGDDPRSCTRLGNETYCW